MIKQSHKNMRKEFKKQKRKEKRKLLAIEHEKNNQNDSEISGGESEGQNAQYEAERLKRHELWLEAEKQAVTEIEHRRLQRENELKRQKEQEQKIREEWEEQQRKDKEEEDRKAKDKEERNKKVDLLLKEATINEKTDDDSNLMWHNPIRNEHTGKEILRECCPFFTKTGACRFGQNCSRAHVYPESSKVLMFPGMFTSFMLEQGLEDEYDADVGLEYEDNEIQQHFYDFYNDVLPEMKLVGQVIQFKVCCNYEPHLRGNVYVAYDDEDNAKNAYVRFNGRFYGGKRLSPIFIDISSWKAAICGLFGRNLCPKGKNCNFLHVFRNPNNEFWYANIDKSERKHRITKDRHQRKTAHSRRSRSRNKKHSHRHDRSRSRSHSRSRNHFSRSQSRTRNRSKSRSQHQKTKKESRHKSRSKSRHETVYESPSNDINSHTHKAQSPHHKMKHKKCQER